MISAPSFLIGKSLKVEGKAILAPMDGYSDLPFRVLTRQLGSAMSFTEFINAIDMVGGHPPHLEERLAYLETERPLVYQIFDDQPKRLLRAALMLEERGPDLIDVNMGCPARSVSNRGAGSGLLKEPEKIAEIFRLLTQALNIPVSGKIRLGWDEDSLNYLEVAKIIEDNGGAMIEIHARHRKQGYKGEANWDAIGEVKQKVSIPVIGNGDIKRAADIERMIDHTGCDAVMIGRAARDNPWIFNFKEREEVTPAEVYHTSLKHLEQNVNFYGIYKGLVLFRKFIKAYLAPYEINTDVRKSLVTETNIGQFLVLLDKIFQAPLVYQSGGNEGQFLDENSQLD
jgi:tRNA-dihydrouridine synthase B